MSFPFEDLLVPAVGAMLVGSVFLADAWDRSKVRAAWPQVAARLGLRCQQAGFWDNPVIIGDRGGHHVRVALVTRGSGKSARMVTVFEVRLARGAPPLAVQLHGIWQVLSDAVDGDARKTGDGDFDGMVSVHGPEAWCAAVLDADVRARLRRLTHEVGGTVSDGNVLVEREGLMRDVPLMVGIVEFMVEVARALDVSHAAARGRLSVRALHAPDAAARQEALRLLCADYASSGDTRTALTEALDDASPTLRLFAAKLLGDAGTGALAALVESAADGVLRAEALEALSLRRPYPELVPQIRAAMTSDADALRAAALALVVAQRDAGQLEEVWMALELGGALTLPEAARAMGLAPHPRSEDELVKLLAHDDAAVRLAAVVALGEMGTSHALAALESLHSLDPRILLAARHAKQAIRAR